MRINIKTSSINLTPDISNYLDKRLSGLEKFFSKQEESAIVDVELARTSRHHQTGDVYKAEINIHIGKRAFRADKESIDIFSAIDLAKSQMEDELRSDKSKGLHLLRRGGKQIKDLIKNFNWRRRSK
jgi:putative sigma-54 modulation protein